MLFQRSKDKQESLRFESPREVEEQTVRRWRDMAASRDRGDKIVIGRIEDEMAYSGSNGHRELDGYTMEAAPSWPGINSVQTFELGEPSIHEEEEDIFVSTTHEHGQYTLGELALDEEIEETVHIPPIQRRSSPQQAISSDTSISVEEDLKRRFGSNIRSALGAGTVIEGTFRFDSPVCVEGTLSGEVYSSSALIVGEGASVSGKITVGSLIVLGTVEGSVEAEELVEIRSTGSLEADIITKRIAIEDGGRYNGRCTLND
jgi:cytoskeletal protein CcmA (bactofilin family)